MKIFNVYRVLRHLAEVEVLFCLCFQTLRWDEPNLYIWETPGFIPLFVIQRTGQYRSSDSIVTTHFEKLSTLKKNFKVRYIWDQVNAL